MEEFNMKCEFCGKEFRVRVTTMNVPGGKKKEEIIGKASTGWKKIAQNGAWFHTGEVIR